MSAFITMNEVTAQIVADDAADHVVTLILDHGLATTDFMCAAVSGDWDAVITRDGHKPLSCKAIRVDPFQETVTVIIGEPS